MRRDHSASQQVQLFFLHDCKPLITLPYSLIFNTGKETLSNFNTVVQGSLGENNLENQLTETSQISYEIQVWTQIMKQKNNDRIETMREEMGNKLETILREKSL